MKPELVSIKDLIPAAYNPRIADPWRLELIGLSLRKLGWVIPVYATKDGEILSGHQRTFIAGKMGWKQVPVVWVPDMDENRRRAVNILFNRATNDFESTDSGASAKKRALELDIETKAKALPDQEKDFAPCLHLEKLNIRRLIDANPGSENRYTKGTARGLWVNKIKIPPVVTKGTLKFVNGAGRAWYEAEKGQRFIYCVLIDPNLAGFAQIMLNLISMDFDIQTRYADLLRHNSFRRSSFKRHCLGAGFVFAVHKGSAKTFDINKRDDKLKFLRTHGTRILDFGAGRLHESKMLENAGFTVTSFEPYRCDQDNQIRKDVSINEARTFLETAGLGWQWNSIFISSVLNSVPFYQDRLHIVRILAALSGSRTKVFACAQHRNSNSFRPVRQKQLSERKASAVTFELDYEPGIVLAELGRNPKVQKGHTPEEFTNLFKNGFNRVKPILRGRDNVYLVAAEPKKIPWKELEESLRFEFDLPYPDGGRMGLGEKAIEEFKKREKTYLKK